MVQPQSGILGIAEAVARGERTAEQEARAALDRAERLAWTGALVSIDPDPVLRAARAIDRARTAGERLGPLAGVPFVVKDNIDAAGWPTTACTPALQSNRPARDAVTVARLKAAGAVVIGKAVMHELAMGGTSCNPHMPPVRNPIAPDRIAGGSSGGTAAAIAAGIAPFGLGSDTGGSVPIPAALCGIAGLRPSMQRYPTAGLLMSNPSRDVIGPMAGSADELRVIDAVMAGGSPRALLPLGSVRLALPRTYFWEGADETVRSFLSVVLDRLVRAGAQIVEFEIGEVERLNQEAGAALRNEPATALAESLSRLEPPLSVEAVQAATGSPAIAERLGGMLAGAAALRPIEESLPLRLRLRDALIAPLDRLGAAAWLVPATPLTAVPIGTERLAIDSRDADFFSYTRSTLPAANAGLPFLTINAGTRDGLPIGLGMIGRAGEDASLLAIGAACERVL